MYATTLRSAAVLLGLCTVLTGFLYPLAVTGIAAGVFPHRASGSIVIEGGVPVGSELIGQAFSNPAYFWSRLSATSPVPYNAAASGGSNYGPSNDALLAAAEARIAALRAADPGNDAPVPIDLVTASGSGLDPHVSMAAARYQEARVARARGLALERVRQLITQHTQPRTFGLLGEPVVNVLLLNLALDRETGRPLAGGGAGGT
jgi:K+-transporting ATPase ATPase C chain